MLKDYFKQMFKRSALQQQIGRSPSQQQQQNISLTAQSPYGSSRYNQQHQQQLQQQQQNMMALMRSPSNQMTQSGLRNSYQQQQQLNSEVNILRIKEFFLFKKKVNPFPLF
jgi:hypothetical protein